MCYHNSINTDKQHLERKYKKKTKDASKFKPIFHANAFQYLEWPVITASAIIQEMNCGLIPAWASSSIEANEIKSKTLNARIETIEEKPSFKNSKPCLIPSTGFFEWQIIGKAKIPYFIFLPSFPIFSMAGIFDKWINEKGDTIHSFSILTTMANPLMETIHNTKKRMPIIIPEELETQWLSNNLDLEKIKIPFDEKQMKAHTISTILSSKNHNVPEVNLPKTIEIIQQLNLF